MLLRHEDDLGPELPLGIEVAGTAILLSHEGRSPREVSDAVAAFTRGAAADAMTRAQGTAGPVTDSMDALLDWAEGLGAQQILCPYAPTGPAGTTQRKLRKAAAARGIALVRRLRPYDSAAWPQATHGFFRFKDVIPDLLARIDAT